MVVLANADYIRGNFKIHKHTCFLKSYALTQTHLFPKILRTV
jgi:hypothetical protein